MRLARNDAGLARQGRHVREPRRVVDGDVQVLHADPLHPSPAVAVNAVPEAAGAAQLLDVQEDQGPGQPPLLPHHSRQRGQPQPPLEMHLRAGGSPNSPAMRSELRRRCRIRTA